MTSLCSEYMCSYGQYMSLSCSEYTSSCSEYMCSYGEYMSLSCSEYTSSCSEYMSLYHHVSAHYHVKLVNVN